MRTTSRTASRVRSAVALACVRAAAVTCRRAAAVFLLVLSAAGAATDDLAAELETRIVRTEFIDCIRQTADNLAAAWAPLAVPLVKPGAADYSEAANAAPPFSSLFSSRVPPVIWSPTPLRNVLPAPASPPLTSAAAASTSPGPGSADDLEDARVAADDRPARTPRPRRPHRRPPEQAGRPRWPCPT